MKAIAFSPAAEADMEAIWDYSVSHWGPDQADRYVDDIPDTCRSLAMEIKRGRVVDVRRGYLKMSSGSHMIYFRDGADGIDVIRVLHGRQDVDRHL
jgi:toxin ParE1/3/4